MLSLLCDALGSRSLHMALTPACINDSYVTYTRKCVVFPAHGSEPRVVDKTFRTITEEDISNVRRYNRPADLLDIYGSEYRKIRAHCLKSSALIPDEYVFYYNMSPKLPLNRCVARLLDIDPDTDNIGLFWRGDVVAIKHEPQSEYSSYGDCHGTDASAIGELENMLRDAYSGGILEQDLFRDELMCK